MIIALLWVPMVCATVAPALAAGPPARATGTAQPWQRAFAEKGVVVHTRSGAGGNMPEFRGSVVMNARIWNIIAVIDDLSAVCEWAKRCIASKELRRISEKERIFYNRTGAPWPCSDRDSVLLGKVSGLPAGRDVRITFSRLQFAGMPPVSGVVRMPVIQGMYRLIALGPKKTRVTFQVRAHPGGWIPDWVARWTTKRIPIDTLDGLRKQVHKTRGRYDAFLKRWDPNRKPKPAIGTAKP